MTLTLSDSHTRLARLHHQRLLPASKSRLSTPAQVLKGIVAVQAQELPAARLSIRARSPGISSAEIEQARQVERSIAWVWMPRGTLHLMTAKDVRWLLPLLAPGLLAGHQRRFRQLGWNEESYAAASRLLQSALADREALSRLEIRRLLRENDLPEAGQATVHLLYRMALEGMIIAGPDRGKETTYVLRERWLGPLQPLPYHEALTQLARRYLEAYAPAAPPDLAKWSGLKASEAREAFRLIEIELAPVQAAGQEAWLLESQLPSVEKTLEQTGKLTPTVNLLPRFDTYLLGYADRDLAVHPAYAARILKGGIIAAAVLVDGRAVGVWKAERPRVKAEWRRKVRVELFEPVEAAAQAEIEAEAAAVEDWLEAERQPGEI